MRIIVVFICKTFLFVLELNVYHPKRLLRWNTSHWKWRFVRWYGSSFHENKQPLHSGGCYITLLTLGDSHTASSFTTCCCSNPWDSIWHENMFSNVFNIDSLKPPTNLTSWCGWSLTTRDLQLVPTNLNWSFPEAQRGPALEGPFHAQKWGELRDWKRTLGDGPGYVFFWKTKYVGLNSKRWFQQLHVRIDCIV